jgi:FdhE protein
MVRRAVGQVRPLPRLVAGPGDIGGVPQAPFLVVPQPAQVFARRAARFAALAEGNPFAAFLRFMAAVAAAQHAALAHLPVPADFGLYRGALLAGGDWRQALAAIADALAPAALPAESAAALRRLMQRPEDESRRFAVRVLDRQIAAEEGAEALFVASALQTVWTLAAGAAGAEPAPCRETATCPLCGGLPVASVVCADSGRQGLRYLACSLCAAEWHHVRIKCIACGNTRGLAYEAVAGAGGPAKAETCPECKAYTKILYAEQDAMIEPLADDLGSLALDVLLHDAGWRRAFPNPFLVPAPAIVPSRPQ